MADSGGRRPLRAVGPGVAGFFSLVLAASMPVLPVIGVVFGLLAALPLVHLAATGKPTLLGWGWVTVVLLGGAMVFRQAWMVAATFGYLIVAALPALAVEAWQRREWSGGRWLALGSGVTLALVSAFMTVWFWPQHPGDAMAGLLVAEAGPAEAFATALAGGGAGAADLVESSLRMAGHLVPAAATVFVQASMLWLRPRLPLLGFDRGQDRYAVLAAEEWLPIPFAIGGLGWVFAGGGAQWFALNLLIVVVALYFFNGLAIIHYHLGARLAANRWVRLLLMLLAIQLPIALSLAALGLVDSFYSLRRGAQLSGGNEA